MTSAGFLMKKTYLVEQYDQGTEACCVDEDGIGDEYGRESRP